MKKVLCLMLMVTFSFIGLSQDEYLEGYTNKIDSETGVNPFAIDVQKTELQKFLLPAKTDIDDDYISSVNQVDFKKLGIQNYFGLEILEMSVAFTEEYGEDEETLVEKVQDITILLELPKDEKEQMDFINAIQDFFGSGEIMLDIDYTEIVKYQWWSEITLLSVALNVELEDISNLGAELGHYKVTFNRAYGG